MEILCGLRFGINKKMFNKKKPNLETIQNLKNYFIKKYEIPESTILSIAELNCHEPDCPPTETVITARSIDGSTKNWKIHKPIDEISENDINDLESMKYVGYPVAVNDAVDIVKKNSRIILESKGGSGAIRELVSILIGT